MDFFSLPIDAGRRDPALGRDELGNPVRRGALGSQYQPQVQPRNAAADYMAQVAAMGQPSTMAQAIRTRTGVQESPFREHYGGDAAKGAVRALFDAAMQGVTAPGRAARGEPVTYGDAWATALDYGALGAPMAAPDGALRANSFRAYHGSPHTFDRFSMDHIGTGEGAQAYGHGLYFAENEAVARGYRDALRFPRMDGATNVFDRVRDDLNYHRGNVDGVRSIYQGMIERGDDAAAALGREKLGVLDQVVAETPGSMYEVQINADPDTFLDWDARLDQQNPQVLNRLGIDPETMDELWSERTMAHDEIRQRFNPTGAFFDAQRMSDDELLDALTAPDVVDPVYARREAADNALMGITRDWASRPDAPAREIVKAGDQVANAERLREAGIPGIKYRDAGSRGLDGAQGTRNFVVFDDGIIDIIRRYGVAGAAPMLGMTAAQLQSEMDAQGVTE